MRRYATLGARNSIRIFSRQYLERGSVVVFRPWKCTKSSPHNRRFLTRQFASRFRAQEYSETFKSHQDSTIYALSTAPGRAGIAIVRISGPLCFKVQAPTSQALYVSSLIWPRSTLHYALASLSQSRDMHLCGPYTIPMVAHLLMSSIRMPWFFTSQPPIR